MTDEITLSKAQETYLEAIFSLETEHQYARVKEISQLLDVKPPTVTRAIQGLFDIGLVHYERYGIITLTEKGTDIGKKLLLRYRATEEFFHTVLGVPSEVAKEIADSFEHYIPSSVLCRMVQFLDYYKNTVINKFEWSTYCTHLCRDYFSADCALPQEQDSEDI